MIFLIRKVVFLSYFSTFENQICFWNGLNFGSGIPPSGDKYRPYWILVGDCLYLGDVDFYLLSAAGVRTTFLRSEQYEILEGLTGVRFDERLFVRGRCVPCCRVGLMPAVWLNGTILVKKLHNKR